MSKIDYSHINDNSLFREISNALIHASIDGDLDAIKHIVPIINLQHDKYFLLSDNSPLIIACRYNHLEVLQYFLTNIDLDFTTISPELLSTACLVGATPIIDYLLYSSEFKTQLDIHQNKNEIFRKACVTDLSMVQYLIFDLNIKKTDGIEIYLTHLLLNPPNDAKKIIKMFEKRELTELLTSELLSDTVSTNHKKLKL